ncbi:MAG TPA: chorismate mutase [Alphaproteobacteria bacterium]|nr:chorismate mutase [Rhodospirillaceae bacterium]HRJ11756.1 chorismate mutase [Alphaproteobacteria bacterium]
MRALADIRKEIDAIDNDIIALLARRFALLPEVVAYKEANGLPPIIPERVREVLERNMATARTSGVSEKLVHDIYEQIINTMCKAEAAVMNPTNGQDSHPS